RRLRFPPALADLHHPVHLRRVRRLQASRRARAHRPQPAARRRDQRSDEQSAGGQVGGMTLLVLTPNPTSAAATRFRLEQYFPALRAAGIEPVLRPFLDEEGFRVLYRRGAPLAKLRTGAQAVVGRTLDLVRAVGADA